MWFRIYSFCRCSLILMTQAFKVFPLLKKFNIPLVLFLFFIPPLSKSQASPFEVYGVGARGSALGHTGVASSKDYTATFYNPAALTQSTQTIGLGLNYALKDLNVQLGTRPQGYDLPDLGPQSPTVPSQYRLQPRQGRTETNHTFMLQSGASSALGSKAFRIGFVASLPLYQSRSPSTSVFNDEREQYFSNQLDFDLLGGRLEHFVFQTAVAYQFTSWLSIGIGAQVMPFASTQNYIYINDAARQDQIDLNIGLQTQTQWRAQGGLLFTPAPNYKMGFSFRDEQYMKIEGQNTVQVRGLQESDSYPFIQEMNILIDYSPRQFTWGGTWQGSKWMLAGDVVYTVWSDFQNHHLEKTDFQDTWSSRIGIEYHFNPQHQLRFGIRYEPTPVGEQTGRTNYIDNTRTVLSLGSGHILSLYEKKLDLSWFAQFHLLHGRKHMKTLQDAYPLCSEETSSLCDEVSDTLLNPQTRQPWPEAQGLQTGNPGFPSFSHGGWMGQFGLEVSWSY